ncbi:MAG: nitroreductase family protein [Planctomycetales bacterium]|nr:nitroreductase family protein [Planctomycetales bacterium]
MNPIKRATTDHPIDPRIAERWSPYAFSDQVVADADLCSLLEAARWAASSYNAQPWSYLVAKKTDTEGFSRMLSCLVDANQAWAKSAPILALGCTHLNFAHNGKPNAAALHDLGLASATLTLEATARGLAVHQMIGIDPEQVSEVYQLPADVRPLTALAIGYAAPADSLPESLRARDQAARTRKPLSEFVFGHHWGNAAPIVK